MVTQKHQSIEQTEREIEQMIVKRDSMTPRPPIPAAGALERSQSTDCSLEHSQSTDGSLERSQSTDGSLERSQSTDPPIS